MGSDALTDTRFVGYRRKLIEDIRNHGVQDLETLQIFDQVPRHIFLPEGVWPRAYEDAPIPIGYSQTASQPSLQAYYLSLLKPAATEKVLEIGTGSGYLTALLALMVERIYSVERVRELSKRARKALDLLGVQNVALLSRGRDNRMEEVRAVRRDCGVSCIPVYSPGTRRSVG